MIPARNIVATEQMRKGGELLGPSQLFQHAAQTDDAGGHSELGQGRRSRSQLVQPAEDVGIALQLL